MQVPVTNFLHKWKFRHRLFLHSLVKDTKLRHKRSFGQNAATSWISPRSLRVTKNLSLFSSRSDSKSSTSLGRTTFWSRRFAKDAEQLNSLHKRSKKTLTAELSLKRLGAGFGVTAALSSLKVAHRCLSKTKILQRTKSTLTIWFGGTKSYSLRIFMLWQSVRLCESEQWQARPSASLAQTWRYGHLSYLHSLFKYSSQIVGRLQAIIFLKLPFEYFSSPSSFSLLSFPWSWKSWERPQAPLHSSSMKLLQICQCLHLFWPRRHEPFTTYCWQIFFLKLIRTPVSSPLWSFTKTNSLRLLSHFLDSGADFLLPRGAGRLKRTGNSTKPPLPQIKLWTFWNKPSSWSSAILQRRILVTRYLHGNKNFRAFEFREKRRWGESASWNECGRKIAISHAYCYTQFPSARQISPSLKPTFQRETREDNGSRSV